MMSLHAVLGLSIKPWVKILPTCGPEPVLNPDDVRMERLEDGDDD